MTKGWIERGGAIVGEEIGPGLNVVTTKRREANIGEEVSPPEMPERGANDVAGEDLTTMCWKLGGVGEELGTFLFLTGKECTRVSAGSSRAIPVVIVVAVETVVAVEQ